MPTYGKLFAIVLLTLLISSAFTSRLFRLNQMERPLQPSIIRVLPIATVLGCWLWATVMESSFFGDAVKRGSGLAIPMVTLAFSLPAIIVAGLTALVVKQIYTDWSRSHRSQPSHLNAILLTVIISLIVSSAAICGEMLLLGPYPDADVDTDYS